MIPTFWKDGYYPGGFASQIALFYNRSINERVGAHVEIKAAYATTQFNLNYINDDLDQSYLDIEIPNISIHFLVGISFGK